jgi:ABC-type spermidine/putrescine transport system permease subunit I
MDDTRLMIGYAIWVIIIGLTLGFFTYFSKKHSKLGSLLFLVMLPTWIITALIKGIESMYFDNSNDLLSGFGIVGLLAETLPMLILIGGITLTLKYLKFRKTKI